MKTDRRARIKDSILGGSVYCYFPEALLRTPATNHRCIGEKALASFLGEASYNAPSPLQNNDANLPSGLYYTVLTNILYVVDLECFRL